MPAIRLRASLERSMLAPGDTLRACISVEAAAETGCSENPPQETRVGKVRMRASALSRALPPARLALS